MLHIDKNYLDLTPKKTFPSSLNNHQNKKIYTLQQIHDNVETIQKHYEQIIDNPISSSSCFSSLKHLTKIFKLFRTKPIEQSQPIENQSPFIFGGETLHWIALPQYNDHIYENELINPTYVRLL
jgi:hypothetical protein